MKHPFARLVLHYSTAAAFATSLSWLLMDLSAPAACLDAGGRFDHARRLCSFDSYEHLTTVAAPMTALISFHVFCCCAIVFVSVQAMLIPRNGASVDQRSKLRLRHDVKFNETTTRLSSR